MSQLQERAKPYLVPLLTGGWTKLDQAGRQTMAAWAVMTAMVMEFSSDSMASTIGERHVLRRFNAPSPRWRVWAGRCEPSLSGDVFGISWTRHADGTAGTVDRPIDDTVVTGFAAGQALFLTFYSRRHSVDASDIAQATSLANLQWSPGWFRWDAPLGAPDVVHDLESATAIWHLIPRRFGLDVGNDPTWIANRHQSTS